MNLPLTACLSILLFIHSLFNLMPTEKMRINLQLEKEEAVFNFFDLSAGEALLIQNWQNETILINTGSQKAQSELEKRLALYEIHAIDHLILTGSGDNYAGNAEWLDENYQIGYVYTTPAIKSKKEVTSPFQPLKLHEELQIIPGLRIKMLREPENEAVTLLIHYGKHTLLFMGYANRLIEKELIENNDLHSDILKVSDFGSKRATSQFFLDHVDPNLAILYKQAEQRPAAQVVERLQESWIDTYLPYRLGLVMIKCDYDDYYVTKILVET